MIINTSILTRIASLCMIFLFLLCGKKMFAQAPSIAWQKVLGGTQWESPTSFQKTSDGGYIVAGVSESKDGDVTGARGSTDIWVIKLDGAGSVKWKKCYGGSNIDFGPRLLEVPNGFIIGGGTSSNNGNVKGGFGGKDIWVFRIDVDGNLIWQKCLGGAKDETLESIALATDGNVFVTFYSVSTNGSMTGNHGMHDAFVGKLASADGKLLWSRVLGGSQDDVFYEVQPTPDGGCILAGTSNSIDGNFSTNHGITDLWVVKLRQDGTDDWSKLLGGSERELGPRLKGTQDGNFIIAANTTSVDGDISRSGTRMAIWLLKISTSGVILNQQVQESGGGSIYDLRITPGDGVIVANSGVLSLDYVGPGNILQKLSSNLTPEWVKEYGGANQDYLLMVQPLSDGSFATFGYSESPDQPNHQGSSDIWLMKLDVAGNIVWEKLYGGANEDKISSPCNHLYHVSMAIQNVADDKGNFFFAAQTYSNNTGDLSGTNLHYNVRTGLKPDIWIAKLSPETVTSSLKVVSSNPKISPVNFKHSLFPNPAGNTATIEFTPQQTAEIILEIIDASGVLVKKIKLANTQKHLLYRSAINLNGLPAGNYHYRIRNGKDLATGKIIKN